MERAALICCATALLFRLTHALSVIDTTEPIVRAAPSTLDDYGYFGYSVVLHRKSDGPWIIVSAPNGTADGGAVENVGVIFECPISQGSCAPLIDNNVATGIDRRLYDIENNDAFEVKEHQFLGVSMESDRNFFVVCAHRHIDRGNGNQRYPLGKCYFTANQDLVNFQVYEPCLGLTTGTYGSCQAGTSATLARNSDDSVSIALGAPGTLGWTGAIFRRNSDGTSADSDGSDVSSHSWQGYAITSGHLLSRTEYHFAISVTRSFTYTGNINIYSNTPNLDVTVQELRGMQMGEYYGFSLETVDLNGDGFDELLVGAPMYSIRGVPEIGRVFIYQNNQGSLTLFETITGDDTQPYTRFGHAITNLGDINNDTFEDFAVSAPFGSSPGTVYIYHGSLTLTQTIMAPAQVISGEAIVNELTGVSVPVGFGSSLASSLDVDDNGINDLAIGAYQSQQVFLFRSRATARIFTQLSANPPVVDLMNKSCTLSSIDYTCFNIEICARYPQDNLLPPTIDVTYDIVVDDRGVSGLMERVFFDDPNNSNVKAVSRTLTRGAMMDCQEETVYVRNDITDVFNGFAVDITARELSFTPNTNDGNPVPTDFSALPVIVTSPEVLALQVELFNDCNGQVCVPDLAIELQGVTYETSSGESTSTLVAGLVTNFNLDLTFSNFNQDAFSAELEIEFPAAFFELVRVEPTTFLIARPSTTNGPVTTQQYLIGNPLGGGQQRDITVRFRPLTTIIGNEGSFDIVLRATSINNENATTLANNEATQTLSVNARADITLDQAVADPEQLTYVSSRDINITTVMDLGPGVTVSFLVLNLGPSTIPSTRMSILWPYRAVDSNYYYLYPAQLMVSSSSASVTSNNTFINPESIQLSTTPDDTVPGNIGAIGNGRKRRRRSLAPVKSHKRSLHHKRQSNSANTPVQVNDITVDCRESNAECVELSFTITQLPGDSSVQIDVVSYLDERYFQDRVDTFTFIASASLSINNSDSAFIIQPINHQQDEIDVQVRVVPIVPTRGGDSMPNLLAIILPIVFGVIFLVILAIVLYFVGFFKRKHKQKKEEIQAEILGDQQGEFPAQEAPPSKED